MTGVEVDPGICGFPSRVEVTKKRARQLSLVITSECDMVRRLSEDLETMDLVAIFKPILDNPVYQVASTHLRHPTCPIPPAILKAAEVEAGIALPRDVSITFTDQGTG